MDTETLDIDFYSVVLVPTDLYGHPTGGPVIGPAIDWRDDFPGHRRLIDTHPEVLDRHGSCRVCIELTEVG